ncbi:MAG: hypothetical protein AB1490_05480 [Pseudomonadota bacterium]
MLRMSMLARHAFYGVVFLTLTASVAFAEEKSSTIGGRTDNPDGSSKVSVGRKLPTEWDTKIGADFNLTAPASNDLQRPDRPFQDPNARSQGSAWATMTMPGLSAPFGWDKTTVEGRVDPQHEQGKLGTRFSRSVPVGSDLSVILEDGYAVTPALRGTAPPPPGAAPETWETDKTARLKVAPTDTTFSIGRKMNGVDQKWLNTFGAEQKVVGPLTVKGGVSETPTGAYDRSISAGFKTTW